MVNGLKTAKDRADEAKKLLEWGFSGFEQRPLFAEGQTIGEAKVFGGHAGLGAAGRPARDLAADSAQQQ